VVRTAILEWLNKSQKLATEGHWDNEDLIIVKSAMQITGRNANMSLLL